MYGGNAVATCNMPPHRKRPYQTFILIKFRSNINDGVKKYLKIQDDPHSTSTATGLT